MWLFGAHFQIMGEETLPLPLEVLGSGGQGQGWAREGSAQQRGSMELRASLRGPAFQRRLASTGRNRSQGGWGSAAASSDGACSARGAWADSKLCSTVWGAAPRGPLARTSSRPHVKGRWRDNLSYPVL